MKRLDIEKLAIIAGVIVLALGLIALGTAVFVLVFEAIRLVKTD